MGRRVGVVEDDENILELVRCCLASAGFEPLCFDNGLAFLHSGEVPELLLLDIMLPDISGYEVFSKMREDSQFSQLAQVPVIFLTAKNTELDKVTGLNLGADDYITKPFGVLELIARVNAAFRRNAKNKSANETLVYKELTVKPASREVYRGEKKIDLTYKEYELLLCLMQNKACVLTREQLLDKVWGYDYCGETRTVDMHVKTLRQKIGDEGPEYEYILTVRGVGYRFAT